MRRLGGRSDTVEELFSESGGEVPPQPRPERVRCSRAPRGERASRTRVARVLRQCLQEGACVDIDGLGTFRRRDDGSFQFVATMRPRVFLAYVLEDLESAERLYEALEARGFQPWLDRRKLLPGQNWPRAIERAIEFSDFFVPCFSRRSASKRGNFQAELRYALDCAARLPLDRVFMMPVRLEECRVPVRISREIQYVDLFPDWEAGFRSLACGMEQHWLLNGDPGFEQAS